MTIGQLKWHSLRWGTLLMWVGRFFQFYGVFWMSLGSFKIAAAFLTAGTVALTVTTACDYRLSHGQAKAFDRARMWLVVELYLLGTIVLFLLTDWLSIEAWQKQVGLIVSSPIVCLVFKSLGLLQQFKWWKLLWPAYYWDCLIGRLRAPYSVSAGLVWLGFGQAFLSHPAANFLLLFGSTLFLCSTIQAKNDTESTEDGSTSRFFFYLSCITVVFYVVLCSGVIARLV